MNFKRYVEASDTWVDSNYIKGTDTDTITTLPATIYPLTQSVTIGLKGNTVQNGTPTPENPVMPQGTGDKTANLCPVANWSNSTTDTRNNFQAEFQFLNGSTLVATSVKAISSVGRYSLTTTTQSAFNRLRLKHNGSTADIVIYSQSGDWSNGATFTISFDVIGYNPTVSGGISLEQIMLNTGSTALPYEPYGQHKIPISSADTTTPVYLGEVQTTRKIKKFVLTGQEEGWSMTSTFRANLSLDSENRNLTGTVPTCTHYKGSRTATYAGLRNGEITSSITSKIAIYDDLYTTISDFKTYLAQQYAAGTPVTVYYVLATTTTGIVNEPLMKIGAYADEVSGITIPTIAGTNTLDVQTTVKPSELTASFNGWHPVSAAHERSGGAWT